MLTKWYFIISCLYFCSNLCLDFWQKFEMAAQLKFMYISLTDTTCYPSIASSMWPTEESFNNLLMKYSGVAPKYQNYYSWLTQNISLIWFDPSSLYLLVFWPLASLSFCLLYKMVILDSEKQMKIMHVSI